MKSNSMYASIDVLTYINTLLVYPDPLGVSIRVTCRAMIRGVKFNQSVTLHRMIYDLVNNTFTCIFLAPRGPPNNVKGFILNATSIKVNWTNSSETNGYVIKYTIGDVLRNVVSTRSEVVLTDLLQMSTYTIMVYSYRDLPLINNTIAILKLDGKCNYAIEECLCTM